jgi:hypothetical protein
MALVTLALTSEEVLYLTADLKDLQPPCSIQSLSETPELAAKVVPPALKECRPNYCTGRPTSWNTSSTPFLKDW